MHHTKPEQNVHKPHTNNDNNPVIMNAFQYAPQIDMSNNKETKTMVCKAEFSYTQTRLSYKLLCFSNSDHILQVEARL